MSKPEPIEEPSLEESLALVRRMLAEAAPPVRPAAAPGAPDAKVGEPANGKTASPAGFDLPSVLRPPAPAADRAPPARGRLTDALRSVSTYPPEPDKRLGLGAVDDDLADLMDTEPQPSSPPPSKDLAPMDLRGRARVAPSFDGDPRSSRSRNDAGEPAARLPSLGIPDQPSLPGPQGAAPRDQFDPFKLPLGRAPAARLPSLDVTEPPAAAPGQAAPPAAEASGWPRGAARSEPELPGLISAPPSEPVVIAAMPASTFGPASVRPTAPPPAPTVGANALADDARPETVVLPMPAVETSEAKERHEDSRFELIAAIGPAVAAVKSTTSETEAPATEPEASATAPVEAEPAAGAAGEPDGGPVEVIAAAEPAAGTDAPAEAPPGPEVIASTEPETAPPVASDESEALPSEPLTEPPASMVTAAVDEVASVLDRLVAGLSASAASGLDIPKLPLDSFSSAPSETVVPPPVPGEPASLVVAAQAASLAESVVSSVDAFIGGIHPHGDEPASPGSTGADAMLKLVGTSVAALGHDGALEAPTEAFDDTVADLLRPMLRKWLESNMPRIVEKALRKELAELQADIQKAGEEKD